MSDLRGYAYQVSAVLAAHVDDYWRPPMTPEQYTSLFEDYISDLEPYSVSEIERAFKSYKSYGSPLALFFPQVGQLLEILRADGGAR